MYVFTGLTGLVIVYMGARFDLRVSIPTSDLISSKEPFFDL
jgi:hypothetical protein